MAVSADELTVGLAHRLLPGSRLAGPSSPARGATAGAGQDGVLSGVSIDSRTILPGQLFVAIRDARDGHDFAGDAAGKGAAALLVERELEVPIPQIIVADTRIALGQLGAAWRARFSLPVACVTGSNGKTTVTQMVASILAQACPDGPGGPASAAGTSHGAGYLATSGNRNNALGVPLMLLALRARHRVAVLELGMNHPGEIAPLAAWARPAVALVNNAQREHQEFLDSVLATARENGAVISALPAGGCAVFPADDACAPVWRALAGTRRVLDFALAGPAAVTARYEAGARASRLCMNTPSGEIALELGLAGVHNVRNALAACAVALALGVAPGHIGAGLAAFRAVQGRGVRRAGWAGCELIDDTYNANPDSVRAAIDTLSRHGGWRLLALGDMAETGREAVALHREVGAFARERGLDAMFATGPLAREAVAAFGTGATHFDSIDALAAAARGAIAARGGAATVLVKGSRSMRMERIVELLSANEAAVKAVRGARGGTQSPLEADPPAFRSQDATSSKLNR
jgi:UDP-N-acetylmuramoyl-tripeptide--D-alanyl-D-alanine ligase